MGIKEDTEFTRQCGLRTIEQARKSPGGKVQWVLSETHKEKDICDKYARGGANGDGVYLPDECPPYPAHDGCKCCLVPAPLSLDDILDWTEDPASNPEIEAWYQENKDRFKY